MASLNRVTLIGNLTRDPEVRAFNDGTPVANVGLATNERWKDKATGETKEASEFHNLVFTARLAEIVQQYLRKGASIYIEGSLHTRKWKDQSGQDRYSTEIKVREMQMLGGRQESEQRQRPPAAPPRQAPRPANPGGFDDMEDLDIPF